jgi:hypothetical protein
MFIVPHRGFATLTTLVLLLAAVLVYRAVDDAPPRAAAPAGLQVAALEVLP